MIVSFPQLLEIAKSCPEDEIVVMSESDFNSVSGEITEDYWHSVEDQEGFFHSKTEEPLGLLPSTLLECMNPDEKVKRFIILQKLPEVNC